MPILYDAVLSDYYHDYLRHVPDVPALAALENQLRQMQPALAALSAEQAEFAYAPGKWTVKEVLGHVADWERIFGYRMLVYARGITDIQPSLDENVIAEQSNVRGLPFAHVLEDWVLARKANLHLVKTFDETMLRKHIPHATLRIPLGVQAALLAGHAGHHFQVLRDRYGLAI